MSNPQKPTNGNELDFSDAPAESLEPSSRHNDATRLFTFIHRYEILLRKHWWVLVLAFVLTLAPICYFILRTPPQFKSTAALWMAGKLNIKEGQVFSEDFANFMGTQVKLLKSNIIQERAMARILVPHPEWETNFPTTTFDSGFPFTLQAIESPKSAIIELTVTGSYPEPTRAFLNAVMDEYQLYRREAQLESSDSTMLSLTNQIGQLEANLKSQQDKMESFAASNNAVFLQDRGSSASAYLGQISQQLSALRTEYQLFQLFNPERLAAIAASPFTPWTNNSTLGTASSVNLLATPAAGQGRFASTNMAANNLLANNSMESLNTQASAELLISLSGFQEAFSQTNLQIQLLRTQRDELSVFLRPNHPRIVKLDDDIQKLQETIDVFKRQSIEQLGNRKQSLELQIQNLEATFKEWETKSIADSKIMAEYDQLKQNLLRTQGQYDRLIGVFQTVDVGKSITPDGVRVIEKASQPKPIRRATKLLLAGVFGAGFISFGLLFLIGRFDDRLSSLADLRELFTEPVIGHIPEVKLTKDEHQILLMRPNDDRQSFAESFRTLCAALLLQARDQKSPKTIVITSSMPSEGKTTIAANFALSLAHAGSKVLLVDADLRRATVHSQFGIDRDPGFADILEHRATLSQVLKPTATPNLTIITAGKPKTAPGDLFMGPSVDLFLREIHELYDYIIVDSAPIHMAADTGFLAAKLDAVIFVIRGAFTSARMAHEALDVLAKRKANILGLVYNRATATAAEYYYYYRRHGYYYKNYRDGSYGDEDDKGKPGKRGKRKAQKTETVPPTPEAGVAREQ